MKVAPGCELCALLDEFGYEDDPGTLVWCDRLAVVVLVEDGDYPGFCRVIWQDHVKEMSELSDEERRHIMEIVWRVELAQRDVMAPDKINLASFGNMTPHVHWHVIPRYADDAHFPQPTWGQRQRTTPEAVLDARRALLPQLRAAIVQRLTA